MKSILAFFTLALITIPAHAKTFRNAYIAFDLPENWDCALEQTEWVCRSAYKQQAREAIIIFTAKEVGPTDTFDAYERHLKSPRTTPSRSGTPFSSKILHVKPVKINDQPWIDGWHLHSEIPNYYTRYLATIKNKIAILITFSGHRLHYTKYSKDFFRAIKSLRVIASKNLLNNPLAGGGRPGSGESLGVGSVHLPGGMMGDPSGAAEIPEEGHGSSGSSGTTYLALALILSALGGYFFIKKKRKT